MSTDKRIDAYIAKAQPFAKPILTHLRALVHQARPDVEETIKWGMPFFTINGANMFFMASFKQHAAMGFPKAQLMKDPKGILSRDEAMGHLGKVTSLEDLPSDKTLIAYIKEAAKVNEAGLKVTKAPAPKKPELPVPPELLKALKASKPAYTIFEGFPPSHRREYIEWITEAKTEATREKRVKTAIEWISDGKDRNWKYKRKA